MLGRRLFLHPLLLKYLRRENPASFRTKGTTSKPWKEDPIQEKAAEIEADQLQGLTHTPVMCEEIVQFLTGNGVPKFMKNEDFSEVDFRAELAIDREKPRMFLDLTFGNGGHSKALLERLPNARVIAIDRDPVAIARAQQLAASDPRILPVRAKFSTAEKALKAVGVTPGTVDGVLIDSGCSSMQLEDAKRGFSVVRDGPLDMRMDGELAEDLSLTAADVVRYCDETDLAKIIRTYGGERRAKKVARVLIESRYLLLNVRTTLELAEVVASALSKEFRLDALGRKSHLATKTFQALRIFVNDELNELRWGIKTASTFLQPKGRLAILTFHSGEATVAKRMLLGTDIATPVGKALPHWLKDDRPWVPTELLGGRDSPESFLACPWIATKKVILPSDEEIQGNPRARSAGLRLAVRNLQPTVPGEHKTV